MRATIDIWLGTVMVDGILLYPLDTELMKSGVDIALELGHPLTDCLYLALAIDLDCELATCDVKFRAKAAPIYPRIKLLADFN